jgi:hypothetical protein
MNAIYKYAINLDPGTPQKFDMPKGAKILSVQDQRDILTLWALVDDETIEREIKRVVVFGTGQSFSDFPRRYISTIQVGSFVWHVFEVL